LKKGLVIKSTGSRFRVREDNGTVTECVLKGKFRTRGLRGTSPVAVGDRVDFDVVDDNTGIIKEISERKNYIIRKSINLSKEYQIIAANIDQAILMVTLREPETRVEFIDRFLVAAESFRIPVRIVFNKTDIYTGDEASRLEELRTVYTNIGYDCYLLSLKENIGLDKLAKLFVDNVSLVSGNSGVGKSTLLQMIDTNINLKIGEISDYHKQGKHTTTFAEMFELAGGGFIIDTPGIKGFGLTELEKEEIYHFFPEIFKRSSGCKYNNCLHLDEPGCAVKTAAENGEITWSRYRSYINIMIDANSKYR
jgi:ribosome biogenesis GTPase